MTGFDCFLSDLIGSAKCVLFVPLAFIIFNLSLRYLFSTLRSNVSDEVPRPKVSLKKDIPSSNTDFIQLN